MPAGQGTQLLWVPPVLKVPAGHTAQEPRLEWWPAAQASVVGLVVGLPLGCGVQERKINVSVMGGNVLECETAQSR